MRDGTGCACACVRFHVRRARLSITDSCSSTGVGRWRGLRRWLSLRLRRDGRCGFGRRAQASAGAATREPAASRRDLGVRRPGLQRAERRDRRSSADATAASARARVSAGAGQARIEDRDQPALELRPVRHRQAGAAKQRGEAVAAQHARHLEQLIGVVRAARAARQHQIVAGPLALGPRPLDRQPGQRIEPVERARRLCQHVRQAVAPLHVRELVQQHDAQAALRPAVGVGRHDDGGPEDARPRPACWRGRCAGSAAAS